VVLDGLDEGCVRGWLERGAFVGTGTRRRFRQRIEGRNVMGRHVLGNGATLDVLMRRVQYGGRKGRRAARRLDGLTLGIPGRGTVSFRIVRGWFVETGCALEVPDEGVYYTTIDGGKP
jgi:hypothetical protein